jgi:dTDP-4-dehydrorhamnose reductase
MRILITGANGMLGRDIQDALKDAGELFPLGHSECEITDPAKLRQTFSFIKPDLVINCAAYTDVDGCERSPELAMDVNARGAGNVARAAAGVGARMYHISTDYVFNGADRWDGKHQFDDAALKTLVEFNEGDVTCPLSTYGKSKLDGEKQVLAHGNSAAHLVIRTSWLYGLHRANFIDRVVEQALSGGPVTAVTDQISCLTWTRDLARRIADLASMGGNSRVTGILHLAGTGMSTRLQTARHVLDWLRYGNQLAGGVELVGTTWEALNLPAKRPSFSAMTSSRLPECGITPLPHWRASLDEYLAARSKV